MMMKKEDKTIEWVINITLTAIALSLIVAGIRLISESETMYQQSYTLTEKVLTATANKSNVGQLPNYSGIKDGYSQALSFFMLAMGAVIVMLLLPRLQTFSISPTGGINVSLQNLQQNVSNLMQQTNSLQGTSTGIGGIKAANITSGQKNLLIEDIQSTSAPSDPNDPQKGKWGGNSTNNERRISAEVKTTTNPSLFHVSIIVESTNVDNPLNGIVNFHLHPTFSNPHPVISVRNGKAVLDLRKVYGAFTVGADLDNGKTFLELNLAKLPDAPEEFKLR